MGYDLIVVASNMYTRTVYSPLFYSFYSPPNLRRRLKVTWSCEKKIIRDSNEKNIRWKLVCLKTEGDDLRKDALTACSSPF